MASLATIGMIAGLAGTAVSAVGTIAAGAAQKNAMDYRAAQEKQAALESTAAAQRTSLEHQRQAGLAQSRLQAVAAASGAGATDPGVLSLGGNIAGRGEYQSLMDMYTGENRAAGLNDAATADEMTGSADQTGSYFAAGGTILGGAASMFDRYNRSQYLSRYG